MPNSASIDQLAAKELLDRVVDKTTGTFKNHSVRIGNSSAVRIDKMKSDRIPFQGFRTATRIASGTEGLRKSAARALSIMARPGKLSAGKLLGAIKATQEYASRLARLGSQVRSGTLELYAPLVESLSNDELSKVFQMFQTPEADLLMTALAYEGRSNSEASDARRCSEVLFDMQALVIKELGNRTSRDTIEREIQKDPSKARELQAMAPRSLSEQYAPQEQRPEAVEHKGDLGTSSMAALAEISAHGATKRENEAGEALEAMRRRNYKTLSPKELGNMLRSSEITINMGGISALSGNSFLVNKDSPMLNIFHLNEQGIKAKGEGYLRKRDSVEKLIFPEFDGQAPKGDERPIYGALNTGRFQTGAARSYGRQMVVVLKPEVMRRATFSIDDSFYAPLAKVTPEKIETFYSLLDGTCSPELARELRDPASKRGALLKKYLENASRMESMPISTFTKMPSFLPEEEEESVQGLMVSVFGDKEGTRNRMASYDSLENLFSGLDDVNGAMMAKAAERFKENGGGRFCLSGNYIEAQVHGPIIPSRDIAEVRINLSEFDTDADRQTAKERALAFGKATGAKITFIKDGTSDIDDSKGSAFYDEGLEISSDHLDPKDIERLVNDKLENPGAALKELLGQSTMSNKLRRRLAGNGDVLMGNALRRALGKFAEAVRNTKPQPGEDTHSVLFVERMFKEAVMPMLELKASLLEELDKLDFETEDQKTAFETWVRSAGKLRSPEELRTIHDCAKDFVPVLKAIAQNPGMAPDKILQTLYSATPGMKEKLNALFASIIASGKENDFGPDDKNNEVERVISMALSLAAKGNPPMDEAAQKALCDALNSNAMNSEYSMISNLISNFDKDLNNKNIGSGHQASNDFNVLNDIANTFVIARQTIAYNLGSVPPEPNLLLDPSFLSPATRGLIDMLSPTAGRIMERYPARAAFPAPASPQAMPANDAQRRQFLVSILDDYVPLERTFERGTSTHGRGHIARTYIFAKAMSSMLEENGVKVDLNAVLCGIAGHNVGREEGGDDRWEQQSAQKTVEAMRSKFPGAMGEQYENAFKAAIITGGPVQTTEAMLLHAADSLDYGRVGTFDLSRFGFLNVPDGDDPSASAQKIRNELKREADLLERITNPLCQYRNLLNHISEEMLDAPASELESLREDRAAILDGIAKAFEEESKLSSEQLMTDFENVLRDNQNMFPLLSRYYFGNAQ